MTRTQQNQTQGWNLGSWGLTDKAGSSPTLPGNVSLMLNEGDLALPDPSHCNWSQQLFFTTFLGPRRSYSSVITMRKTTSYQHFTLVNISLWDSDISSPALVIMLKKGLGCTDTEISHQSKTQSPSVKVREETTRQGQCFP